MKEHFQQRIDDTRQSYLDALDRLKSGNPTHKNLIGKEIKINATTIALEAGKSRNPLYHTHKNVLDMIVLVKEDNKVQKKELEEKSEISLLQEKCRMLEEENRKLLNVNAILLFQSKSKI